MFDNKDRLIVGLKKGDKSVFEEVYREYYIPLCFYSLKYVEKIEDAEEIVQNLFLKLWEKRKELEINSSLKAYLYRAIQNYALNYLSKKKTINKYVLHQEWQSYDNSENGLQKLEAEELSIILKHALLKLPEKRRRIFELSRFDGLKYGKIALRLAISVKTVETQMTKALKYLRVILKEYVPILIFLVLINNML